MKQEHSKSALILTSITFICEAGALKVRPNLDGLLGQLTLDIVNQDLHNNNHFHTKKVIFLLLILLLYGNIVWFKYETCGI